MLRGEKLVPRGLDDRRSMHVDQGSATRTRRDVEEQLRSTHGIAAMHWLPYIVMRTKGSTWRESLANRSV